MSPLNALFASVLLASLLPSTTAHMGLYHPSVYGFNEEHGLIHEPLLNKPTSEWFFHGYQSDTPKEVMSIKPGQPLTVGISCRKTYSAYGATPDKDACPMDSGAYHAGGTSFNPSGWVGNTEDLLMGCALAIAPTKNAASTKPEDFIVMSTLANCVRQRDTTFQIPDNLPECPEGECTCAWLWQGHMAQDEMYFVGYRCKVEGGKATAWPKPVKPKRGNINGATQPMYWANTEGSNIDYAPNLDTRPSYNKNFGWSDGAQTSAFGAAGGTKEPVPAPVVPEGGDKGNTPAEPVKSPTPAPVVKSVVVAQVEKPAAEEKPTVNPAPVVPAPVVKAVDPPTDIKPAAAPAPETTKPCKGRTGKGGGRGGWRQRQ